MKDRLKQAWESLSPKEKHRATIIALVVALLIGSVLMYKMTRSSSSTVKEPAQKKKEISLEPRVLEKNLYNEGQKAIGKIAEMQKQIEDLKKQVEASGQGTEQKPGEEKDKNTSSTDGRPSVLKAAEKSAGAATAQNKMPDQPPPPPPIGSYTVPPPPQGAQATAKTEIYGDISMVSQTIEKRDGDDKGKKKESMKIYLPPSFMEATLLSGLDAPTTEGGKGSPVPVLLRIKDLAVLPNKVKADLKGCFVVAEGHGNLSDERAHLRLITLSCLSRKGQAVIDHKVKGFVVDADGKVGLRGTVVSKMGSSIARSLIAGLFGGAGDAFKYSATTTSYSALGSTQVIDQDQLAKAAVGGALGSASKDIAKFYLELGKSSFPVIEIGAMKNVTLVITEGTEMEIKEKENNLRR
jgi:conjugal transfer pilus assembly protein TraB